MMNRNQLKACVEALISNIKSLEALGRDSIEFCELVDLTLLLRLKKSLEDKLKVILDLPPEMPESRTGDVSLEIDATQMAYKHVNNWYLSIKTEIERLIKPLGKPSARDKPTVAGLYDTKVALKRETFENLLGAIAEKIFSSTNPHRDIANEMIHALTSNVSQHVELGEPYEAYHTGVTILTLLHRYSTMGLFSADAILKGAYAADGTFFPLPSYPDYYQSDVIFARALHAIQEHRATFGRIFTAQVTAMRGATDKCQQVIISLETYCRKNAEHCAVLHERYNVLVGSLEFYHRSVRHKLQFLSDTQALRTLSAADTRVISSHDKALGSYLHNFQAGVTRWADGFEENAELVFTRARASDVARLLGDLTEGHMLSIGKLAAQYRELSGPVEALRHKMKQDIGNAHAAFQQIYASFNSDYWEHPGARETLHELKATFDRLTAVRLGHEVSFVDLDANARELMGLNQQLEAFFKQLDEYFKAQLRAEIVALKENRNQRIQEIARRKRETIFEFNHEEEALYQKVISSHVDSDDVTAFDYNALAGKRRVLSEQLRDVEACEAMMELHQFVTSNLIGPNMGALVGRINTERDPTALLSVIGHYVTAEYESNFLSRLSSNLHLIQPAKLSFIQGLLTNREGDNVDEIKRKLVFMELQGLTFPARIFLQNPDAISAALLLKELGRQNLITREVLSNESFCKAVQVLRRHNVDMDADSIQGLVGDNNKCEIICQQEQLFQDQMRRNSPERLTPEIYEGLLQWFLAADERVSKAVNKVRLDMPDYFTPLLLVLIQENKTLRDLICDEALHYNAPFLLPMLKRLTAHQMAPAAYLGNYLCPQMIPAGRGRSEYRQVNRVIGKEEIRRAFSPDRRDQKILEILMAANQPSLQRSRFRKMSALMITLNEYIDDRLSHFVQFDEKYILVQRALEHFRRDAVLLLLSKDSEEKKKVNFEKLAYKHFQHPNYAKNVLLDVLQFITGLFVIVMPCRYLLKQTLFFSAAKSDLHKQASQVLQAALVDLPRRVPERSTSSVPS